MKTWFTEEHNICIKSNIYTVTKLLISIANWNNISIKLK